MSTSVRISKPKFTEHPINGILRILQYLYSWLTKWRKWQPNAVISLRQLLASYLADFLTITGKQAKYINLKNMSPFYCITGQKWLIIIQSSIADTYVNKDFITLINKIFSSLLTSLFLKNQKLEKVKSFQDVAIID